MSRLQKKCFIGATSMHVLLFVVLIVGPGFFSKDETMDESELIIFTPQMATDSARSGGGTPQPPNPTPPAPQVPTPTPPKLQEAPPPEPPKPREVVRETPREIEKVEEKTPPRDTRESLDPTPDKPKKHEVKVSRNVVKISPDRRRPTTNSSNTDTAAQERKDQEFARAIARTGSRVKDSLSTSTKVDMPDGPGGGGVSYAPYAQIVRKVYTDAWTIPDDVTDDEAVVKVSVTIRRDGTVASSSIIMESGSRLVDRSIQNALNRVTTIGVAFPAGAKESQRTFTISFSLKAKKLLG